LRNDLNYLNVRPSYDSNQMGYQDLGLSHRFCEFDKTNAVDVNICAVVSNQEELATMLSKIVSDHRVCYIIGVNFDTPKCEDHDNVLFVNIGTKLKPTASRRLVALRCFAPWVYFVDPDDKWDVQQIMTAIAPYNYVSDVDCVLPTCILQGRRVHNDAALWGAIIGGKWVYKWATEYPLPDLITQEDSFVVRWIIRQCKHVVYSDVVCYIYDDDASTCNEQVKDISALMKWADKVLINVPYLVENGNMDGLVGLVFEQCLKVTPDIITASVYASVILCSRCQTDSQIHRVETYITKIKEWRLNALRNANL